MKLVVHQSDEDLPKYVVRIFMDQKFNFEFCFYTFLQYHVYIIILFKKVESNLQKWLFLILSLYEFPSSPASQSILLYRILFQALGIT